MLIIAFIKNIIQMLCFDFDKKHEDSIKKHSALYLEYMRRKNKIGEDFKFINKRQFCSSLLPNVYSGSVATRIIRHINTDKTYRNNLINYIKYDLKNSIDES